MHYKSREEAEVKDPFEDLLDLSESVLRRMKKFRLVLLFGLLGGLLAGATLLMVGAVRIWLSASDILLTVAAILGGAASIVVFFVSNQLEKFLIHFERRMDTLSRTKDFDPNPPIPNLPTPTERIMEHLKVSRRELAEAFHNYPGELIRRKELRIGKQLVRFDAYFLKRRYRFPSIQIFVRISDEEVGIDDLQQFKNDVQLAAKERRLPPTRAIIVQTYGETLSDEVVNWVENNWIVFPPKSKPGKEWHSCPVEVFLENPSGFYDLAVFYMG